MRSAVAMLALVCVGATVACTSGGSDGVAVAPEVVEHPEWAEAFADANTVGTFVARRIGDDDLHVVDAERAASREIPASTFKILNSLIILDRGVVADVDEVLPWDRVERGIPAWDRDQTMRQAIEVSAVWAYQHWAREVGLGPMRENVAAADYGNGEIGDEVDRFWLDGPLRISAIEQVDFLGRLADGELPFDDDTQAAVREVLVRESGPDWAWSHKTGTSLSSEPQLGWLVGLTEFEDERWAFALHLDLPRIDDVGTQLGPTARIQIARELLVELGALPS